MEDKSPIFILLVLFILVGLAYGPFKESKKFSQTNSTSIGSNGSQNVSGSPDLGYSSNPEVASQIKDVERDLKRLEENINKTIEESRRSPYYGKIRMSNISGVYYNDPNREYTQLSASLNRGESLNITGWYLKSETTGYYAIIGRAALLPFPFTRTESDIVLLPGDRVYLTKGFSPIGISFRTNKCTGYFEENREFVPSLSLQCPRPIDEDLPNFSSVHDRNDECLDFLERIPRCGTINNETLRDLPDTVTRSCKNYVATQINYNSCVARHFGDTDFPGNEYRVYLNRFGPLWREKREKINLHDHNGLIVDTISY